MAALPLSTPNWESQTPFSWEMHKQPVERRGHSTHAAPGRGCWAPLREVSFSASRRRLRSDTVGLTSWKRQREGNRRGVPRAGEGADLMTQGREGVCGVHGTVLCPHGG